MAKSARASTKKRNNVALRKKVFGPAIDARTERLSAKLQEIANAPKPESEKKMDVDEDKEEKADVPAVTEDQDEAMQWTGLAGSATKQKRAKATGRLNKVAKRKPRNQVVFPSEMARKKRQAKRA
ncbi:hypothetical protein PMZ80_002219 [Knufia obscura]|uniref:DUF2423 domain-containing protein n=2 Tax=Knufia TaxID=430999 RepID=A0AAN8EX05_9EURO|nr:hypothetical protein PMZ80_002219 [Knufia obscura]KAK5947876.1 hypothetical protein OHC33_011083 [Knufia fluminis]